MKVEDTYFSTYDEALVQAEKQIVFGPYSNLQICYYPGEEKQDKYENLINLPDGKISEKLLALNTRLPTKILLKNPHNIKHQLNDFKEIKKKLHGNIVEKIKKQRPNFKETLRVYIGADYGGKTVLDMYKCIRETFENMGYDVYYEENNSTELMDDFQRAKSILKYNPHITFNINRIRNNQLHEDVFNFIWFADPTLILYDNTDIQLRKNDYVFYTLDEFKNALVKKGVNLSQLYKQEFITNSKNYYIDQGIKRENKIVFIGSNFDVLDDLIANDEYHSIIKEKIVFMVNNRLSTPENIDKLAKELYDKKIIKSEEHFNMFCYPVLGRLEVVKWLCTQTKIDVEIYGNGWENIDEVKPFHKGIIDNKDVYKVYNSAKYSLLVPSHSFYQQRLFEATLCGAITFAWDDPNIRDECSHRDCIVTFKDKNDLIDKIGSLPKRDIVHIVNDLSNTKFIEKMIGLIKN